MHLGAGVIDTPASVDLRGEASHEVPIARVAETPGGHVRRHPDRAVVWLRRRSESKCGRTEIDVTDLLRPDLVFRHVGEALEDAELSQDPNFPACLLETFAV